MLFQLSYFKREVLDIDHAESISAEQCDLRHSIERFLLLALILVLDKRPLFFAPNEPVTHH